MIQTEEYPRRPEGKRELDRGEEGRKHSWGRAEVARNRAGIMPASLRPCKGITKESGLCPKGYGMRL